ncbi:MAG: hypothetical protein JWO69_744 [Thermoleophilia bacterium]|jgi:hypothetical protein|nr:hypothetical protein [Thermoleophilia bacterium]
MLIAPVAFRTALAPTVVHSDFANLQVVVAGPVVGGRQTVVQDSVNLGVLPKRALGGARVTSTWVDGVNRRSEYEQFRQSTGERAAAQALADAIEGSGLVALLRPTTDNGTPAAGRTRIYVDRRAQFIEFATGDAPAAAQAVLEALTAYRANATR